MMAYQEVQTAIATKLSEFVGIMPVTSFKSPNAPLEGAGKFIVPNNGKWSAYFIQYGPSFISGISDKPCTRRAGVLTFQIFYPKGQGTAEINQLAEQLTQHFQYFNFSHMEILEGSKTFEGSTDTAYQLNLNFTFRVNT